jgi:hypothetical protein
MLETQAVSIGILIYVCHPERVAASRSEASGTDHVGTAALGCPAERSSAVCSARSCRASLDRTAEGGCPHVVSAIKSAEEHTYIQLIGVLRLRVSVRKRTNMLRSG